MKYASLDISDLNGKFYKGEAVINGQTVFVKSDPQSPKELFHAEAKGLAIIKDSNTVKVPEVAAVGDHFLVTTYISPNRATKELATKLGYQLANLHKKKNDHFGTTWPTFIGPLRLPYAQLHNWVNYQQSLRLGPLFEIIKNKGLLSNTELDTFYKLINTCSKIPHFSEPSLVHGDLWAGNIIWSNSDAFLIDPSCHYGDPMCDIAMSYLFPPSFHDLIIASYKEILPIDGYQGAIELNKCFYLAVHLILFGPIYKQPLMASINNALRA